MISPLLRLIQTPPIGSVTVKADWIASSLTAGAAYDENFGDDTDRKNASGENPDIIAFIAKITIRGTDDAPIFEFAQVRVLPT